MMDKKILYSVNRKELEHIIYACTIDAALTEEIVKELLKNKHKLINLRLEEN